MRYPITNCKKHRLILFAYFFDRGCYLTHTSLPVRTWTMEFHTTHRPDDRWEYAPYTRTLFAKPGFCTRGVCGLSRHLPFCYRGAAGWITEANADVLSQRLPREWLHGDDVEDQDLLNCGMEPSGFVFRHISNCAYLLVKEDIPLELVKRRWDGCKLISDDGKYYVYISCKYGQSQGHTLLPPPATTVLRDLCFEAAISHKCADLSQLPIELIEEMQKRTCPQDQHAMGFQEIKTYHYNGQLCEKIPLNAGGEFDGCALMWSPKGNPMISIDFKNGVMHGKCITHDGECGLKTSETTFQEGIPFGERVACGVGDRPAEQEFFHPAGCDHRILSEFSIGNKKKSRLYIQCQREKDRWIYCSFKEKKDRDIANSDPSGCAAFANVQPCACSQRKRKKLRCK